MRKTIFAALAMSLLCASCDIATFEHRPDNEKTAVEWAEIRFSAADQPGTKSTALASETAISNLQILVYGSGGTLVAYGRSSGQSLDVSVPLGVSGHKVYAVANVNDDLSSCSTPASLTSKTSYLRDNSLSSLQMIGSLDNQTFTSGRNVVVTVTRFVSRVQIDKISCAFTAAAHKSMAFKVNGIFLINVSGSSPYSQIAGPDVWYNQLRYVSGDCNSLISDMFASPATVQSTSGSVTPYSTRHYFYCYANPTKTDAHGGSFSARRTRLVVETTLGDTTYYYPIDVVAGSENTLAHNTTYTITELMITGPGVPNPDDKLDNGTVSFTVRVEDWATGFSKTVTY